jgi:cell division protein FtsB
MDNQYYRKSRPKFAGWLKNTFRKKSVVVTLLIALPALSFIIFSNKGILQRYTLEAEKRDMLKKLEQSKFEQSHLKQTSKALDSDPKAIEKVAREKYGMIKDGETVYKVKKEQR